MKDLKWEFTISFISIAVIIGFAMFIAVSSSTKISLVGWFIMVFSILALIGVLFGELEAPSQAQQPAPVRRIARRVAKRRRR